MLVLKKFIIIKLTESNIMVRKNKMIWLANGV